MGASQLKTDHGNVGIAARCRSFRREAGESRLQIRDGGLELSQPQVSAAHDVLRGGGFRIQLQRLLRATNRQVRLSSQEMGVGQVKVNVLQSRLEREGKLESFNGAF